MRALDGRLRWAFGSAGADGFVPGVTQPTASNTGCQTPQSQLTVQSSTVTITTDDTVIENTWFRAGVIIQANRVILRNCLINENANVDTSKINKIAVLSYLSQYVGTLLDRCTIVPANPDVLCYGLVATNTTTHRCYIAGGWTDAVNWQTDTTSGAGQRPGSCFSVGDFLSPTVYSSDPHQGNGMSHSDCIQIANGRGHTVFGTTLQAIKGSGPSDTTSGYDHSHGMVIGPYATGGIGGVHVESCWFLYGGAQLSAFPNGATDKVPVIPDMVIVNNRFDATGTLNALKGGTYNPQSILMTPATFAASNLANDLTNLAGNVQIGATTPPSGGTAYGASSSPTNPVKVFVQIAANG